jgi:hypothetical protein
MASPICYLRSTIRALSVAESDNLCLSFLLEKCGFAGYDFVLTRLGVEVFLICLNKGQ